MLTLPHIGGFFIAGHASFCGQSRSEHRYEEQSVAVAAGELCHAREAFLARVSSESAPLNPSFHRCRIAKLTVHTQQLDVERTCQEYRLVLHHRGGRASG